MTTHVITPHGGTVWRTPGRARAYMDIDTCILCLVSVFQEQGIKILKRNRHALAIVGNIRKQETAELVLAKEYLKGESRSYRKFELMKPVQLGLTEDQLQQLHPIPKRVAAEVGFHQQPQHTSERAPRNNRRPTAVKQPYYQPGRGYLVPDPYALHKGRGNGKSACNPYGLRNECPDYMQLRHCDPHEGGEPALRCHKGEMLVHYFVVSFPKCVAGVLR